MAFFLHNTDKMFYAVEIFWVGDVEEDFQKIKDKS
jgi:hypothetical protein